MDGPDSTMPPPPPSEKPSSGITPPPASANCLDKAEPLSGAATLAPAASTSDLERMEVDDNGPAYSTFSKRTKVWVTAMVTIGSLISPMTAFIYFPALNPIAKDLHVSTSLINLTLTTYIIVQSISPPLLGDFGDMAGRRPAFILAFTIYFFANIGLALQRDYAALIVLRCLQSGGSSGTLALGYAVIADISSSAERGKYMGIVGIGVNIGPAIGPVFGGVLSQYLGWPSIFWFCAIFVFVWLMPWIAAVPETCRSVVGNGSIPPPKWNMTLTDYIQRGGRSQRPASAPTPKLRCPNPVRTLSVVFEKEMGLILFISAIIYLCFILVSATLATLFKEIYKYDNLEVGLCYLPYGIGSCISSVVQGYVLDWNYRRTAKKLGLPVSRRRGDDLSNFPIESARIQPVYPSIIVGSMVVIAYGWALEAKTSVAVPLVLTFLIGLLVTSSFNVLNTLVVDLNPSAPATAAAANNLVRCSFGAVGTAVISYMLDGMGKGWCFTFLALLIVACIPGMRVIEKRGPHWRALRIKRQQSAL